LVVAQPAARLTKKRSVLAANQVNLLQAVSGKREAISEWRKA
jgi:hypothetical protein